MKKISTLLIGILAMMFISCDEDVMTAYRLEGDWYGDMGMFYGFTDRYGRYYEVDASQTNIRFYWDGDAHGHGEQIDFYDWGPYRYQSYYFKWRVVNGVIQMVYPYDSESLDCDIYRWSISYDYDPYTHHYTDVFAGYINNHTRFLLFKLENFNGWNSYGSNYYGYSYYDDYYDYIDPYYYSKTRGEVKDTLANSGQDEAKGEVKEEVKVVKRGSRFIEDK
jgi:hypothetical protein